MKMRRIVSPDMRKAMAKIREELGPDAVILSSKKVSEGMEVVAAIDYDEQDTSTALELQNVPLLQQGENQALQTPAPRQTQEITAMRDDIDQLRTLMENQIAMIGWGEMSAKSPYRAKLLKRLAAIGLGKDLSEQIINELVAYGDSKDLWPKALHLLGNKIPVTDDDILNNGGVISLVGATGVGKTTTVAKLASRFAMRHGSRNVALVTTDNYRICAHDHLMAYGRILQAPVLVASNKDELHDIIRGTQHKKLVIIDTAGMSHRDVRLTEQLATLKSEGDRVKNYLVLSANTQTQGLNDIVRAFSQVPLEGCIVTKQDEAGSLGGVLTTIARHQIPVAYVADGQRVPEDIHPARADRLIRKAVEITDEDACRPDDESMAIQFGGMATALRA